jgi:tetratricopeptide (TPR) repeat protein
MIGTAVVIALLASSAAFVLHRGCVISECKELQTAQQFKSEYQQQIKRTKSQKDLLTMQQKLDKVVADLQEIPEWSPRYQDSQVLVNSFSEQSTKINQVLKALQIGSSAQKKTQTPPQSLDELRNRQKLWREAITSLEIIKPSNELYGLVTANLSNYQNTLKTVNDQLLKEETWVQRIANAKTLGENATKRQATAKSAPEWQKVESDFQTAINTLKIIPIDSLETENARKLLAEYQPKRDRAKKEQLAATSYQQAIKAANQAQAYSNQNQWQGAVKSWEQALEAAKQVSQDSFYFNQATALIEPYTASLKQAQEQLQIYGDLTQTRAELNSTCTNTIKICTFTIKNQKISVRLTAEYDRLLQANNREIQSHFQSLKYALAVIGQNAQLPVFIYNAQGQERDMR